MSGSLLIPCDVSAKVIQQPTNVSSLAGQPFADDAVLEPGVHLHWALPDALTRATIENPDANNQALFPGVPDLWLVVRFNPLPAGANTRSWTAWVVDSQAQTATPLANWHPPAAAPATILTQAGLLAPADALGHPGWGSLAQNASYDVANAAYYPAARNRFGFYDPTPLAAGDTVSYAVVGWYSTSAHDPLTMAADRVALLEKWKLSWDFAKTVGTPILAAGAVAQVAGTFKITSTAAPAPDVARVQQVKRTAVVSDPAPLMRKVTAVKDSFVFSAEAVGAAGILQALEEAAAPASIVCHGSVVGVTGSSTSGAGLIPGSQITLHPSIKRALAAVTNTTAADRQLDFTEMMLQNLDSQTGTTAGVLDLPGAAQALSFQSAPSRSSYFATMSISAGSPFGRVGLFAAAGGNWPAISGRSAALSARKQGPGPTPNQPQRIDEATWASQLLAALQKTVADAGASKAVDPRFIYVTDSRSAAQPVSLGITPDGTGPENAGWWLDTADANALAVLYTNTAGASVEFPSASALHEVPGPRWYRPWSPQIVLTGAGRSYRFGYDGRFEASNQLACRTSGNTVASITVNGSSPLKGGKILGNVAPFKAAGLPAETLSLVEEAALLDAGNAPLLALQPKAASKAQCGASLLAFYATRDRNAPADIQMAASALTFQGRQPSPVAITPHQDPFDPLFLDAKYTYSAQPIEGWQLQEDFVELTRGPHPPPSDPHGQQFAERTRVTSSVADVLKKALVTNRSTDMHGALIRTQKPPQGVSADQMDALNVVSAPLVHFDDMLFAAGRRLRCGELHMDQLALVDVFGIRRVYPSPQDKSAAPANLVLTPRLPSWSRLNFRLRSAADPSQDASRTALPVCGFLVPDYLDHTLNVFDSSGAAIGQIACDHPGPVGPDTANLAVSFKPYPWITFSGDPTSAIADPTVRSFVQALIQHGAGAVTTVQNGPSWVETGLTALLRVIDTIRGTLDPLAKTQDRRVKLVGDPIAIFHVAVSIDCVVETDAAALAQSPTPVAAPPALPAVPVRIGDLTRPDDAVLGIFDPANGKFAPVSPDAASSAILSALTIPNLTNQPVKMPVTHPFIEAQKNTVTPNAAPLDLVILADVRGGYYATCGVLPRKKITMPKEYIQPALDNIEPVFRVGPLATLETNRGLEPVMTSPQIETLGGTFVHAVQGANQTTSYPADPVPPAMPLADLPAGTITLDGGFIRMAPPS